MIRVFYHINEAIEKTDQVEMLNAIAIDQLLWVDLQYASAEEQESINPISALILTSRKKIQV
jgi:hypothetical protein